jgi:hypothetical protein
MRQARTNSGLPANGDTLTPFRSPLGSSTTCPADLSFCDWKVGDDLPAYTDHSTGIPLHDDPHAARDDTPAYPPDWSRRFPDHPSFGPRSTVPVPVPPAFPSALPDNVVPAAPPALPLSTTADTNMDLLTDDSSSSSDSTDGEIVYTTRDRDKDISRGMGHHLRWPSSHRSPSSAGTKRQHRQHPNISSTHSSPIPVVVPAPPLFVPPASSVGCVDSSGPRVQRSRRHPPAPPAPVQAPRPRIPVMSLPPPFPLCPVLRLPITMSLALYFLTQWQA